MRRNASREAFVPLSAVSGGIVTCDSAPDRRRRMV
jgi:hypothetical protein